MLFASFTFLFAFLPAVLLGWWLLPRSSWRVAFLALASYVFYGWWDWRYLPLLWAVTLSDFFFCHFIGRSTGRRRTLGLVGALVVDLGALGVFKYTGFFLSSLNGLGHLLGAGRPFPALHILLPVGISFYVFSSVSCTIDVYRGRQRPPRSLLHFAAFVAMFPRLLAGPIARYGELGPQLERPEARFTWQMAGSGLWFLACGMVKKLFIADVLAPHVNSLFAHNAQLGVASAWVAALGYTMQLYFDFSGYSDMAVGVGLLMGLRLPQNFNSPYKSASVSEFWRRWHMTLSFWVRDYLFISLGGSRGGRWRTVRNLMITMTLAGLWHGSGWTYVLWGAIWGAYLSGHTLVRRRGAERGPDAPWLRALKRGVTFILVIVAWVPFRAPSMAVTGRVLGAMIGLNGIDSWKSLTTLVGWRLAAMLGAALVFVNAAPNTWDVRLQPRKRYALAIGLLMGASILMINHPLPFLYLQF